MNQEEVVKEVVKVIDIVKGTIAKFVYAQSGSLFYKVETETHVYIFPVDLTDKIRDISRRFQFSRRTKKRRKENNSY